MASQLSELLVRGVQLHGSNSEEKEDEGTKTAVDITDEFYTSCAELSLGEVLFMPGFRLNDAMSAVELMDPKMDIGISRYMRKKSIQSIIEQGYFESISDREVLTIVDATLCCLVSYLEGGNIANTLFTNLLICDYSESIPNETLKCLSIVINHLIPMIRSIISGAMVFEEEDFNATVPYLVSNEYSFADVLERTRNTEEWLNNKAKSCVSDRYVLLATSSRLSWLRQLMELMSAMVPPLASDGETMDGKNFKPKLRVAAELADGLTFRASTFVESTKLGLQNEKDEGEDGKFEWLTVFEADYNKLFLSGSFPRKTIIPNRKDAMLYLYELSCRLHRIATQSAANCTDYVNLMGFFKDFAMDNSCCLTRSVLQLTVLPHDELVLGETPLSDLVEVALRSTIKPMVLMEGSSASRDEQCLNLYADFLEDFTKAALTVISVFGLNLARQREKLGMCIEEMCITQGLSDQLDKRTLELVGDAIPEGHPMHPIMGFVFNQIVNLISYHVELSFKLELFAPQEFSYVYWYLGEIVCRWHINTLERFQEVFFYEFKEGISQTSKKNKKKNASARRSKNEDALRQKVEFGQVQMMRRYGEAALAQGVAKTTVALIKSGKMKVPCWDGNSLRVLFEHRMAPYRCLGPPLHLNYDQYIGVSKVDEWEQKEVSVLFEEALESFELAKSHFSKFALREDMADEAQLYIRLCKNNAVVVRLLSSGRMEGKTPEWTFPEKTIFPLLKLS